MSRTTDWVIAEQERAATRHDGPDDRDYHLDVAVKALKQIRDGKPNVWAIVQHALDVIESRKEP